MTDNAIQTSPFLVAALYHFVSLARYESLQQPLQALCEENGVKGTLLLAHEGINGTIAGRMPASGPCSLSCVPSRNFPRSSTRKAMLRKCLSCG